MKLLKYVSYKLYSARDEYKRAAKADDLCSFICDFENYLRGQYKWAETPDDIEQIREEWYRYLDENFINLDELYR
ncbi:MAG: hypothetical protein GY706_10175 [Bacteroides sp.]|nr:hypothetical protein [Bacteroides sp.]